MQELIEKNWSKKDYKMVFLIAYILGLLGVHQFYLGNKKAGFIRLMLTLSLIGTPVSIFLYAKDLIQLMRSKIADSEGNFVRFPGFWARQKAAEDYLRKKTGQQVQMDPKEKANKARELIESIKQNDTSEPSESSQEEPDNKKKSEDLLDNI